ncbi:dihydropteroate synthase [Bacillus pakistanensis]|uniref:Dihydropteroate synthase n=2 Tax=Rossellomorea pakistanensis TaxID=992288 RepID=A0ABS2NKD7_9BACI|nr:dihydropteroate synthase [Bacillus pakistanensis]
MNSIISCGSFQLDLQKKTMVMGILNITPDSFSDGGHFYEIERAVAHAKQMVHDGADLIDIGGESTRPGHAPVTVQEEINRVVPVIKAISKAVAVPISIDTYKAETAKQAILAGAHIINDIWGAKKDPNMAKVAAELGVPIILMHNRENRDYQQFIPDVIEDLEESIRIVKESGVREEQIILDPGIGFAKDVKQNIEMMQNLDKVVEMNFPVLLATSRKSTIGHILDLPVEERMEGTGATVCYGIQKGCHMIRVHDVKEMSRMAKMMDALTGRDRKWTKSI